ncbi:MAG: class I SAM-dependent methyltransferase [Planctomycetota bacterium]
MKPSYLKYYDKISSLAPFAFLRDALFARSKVRKLSLANRQRDYARLQSDPRLLALHRQLNRTLLAANEQWSSYDYGEGYFYQGFDEIGVTGLRNTRERLAQMQLHERLRGLSVLEIGCNAGFLSLSIARVARQVVAFDLNPHLVDIGIAAARHLGLGNVDFRVGAFEELAFDTPFDAVLSFANHSTYDGNTHQDIAHFFTRCHELTRPGGLFLFESHPPAYEGAGLDKVLEVLSGLFTVEERRVLAYGSFLDTGRTFVVARRPGGRAP